MRPTRGAALLAALALVPLAFAAAPSFPDVPKTSPNFEAITKLAELGVIGGNPDGTFRPKNAVNRAALLKMLYKASAKTPDVTKLGCFGAEFKSDAWFAPYVCDALALGYVKGYADGKFRAENPVSLAEAVKMTFTVFAIPQPDLTAVGAAPLPGVPADAWFADYVNGAVYLQLLPLPGQTLAEIYPGDPLSREQAAALVYAGWKLKATIDAVQPASSSSASSADGSASSASSAAASSASSKAPYKSQAELKSVSFPFQDQWKFSDRNSISYNFTVSAITAVDVTVTLGSTAGVQCRLSRIESDGFVLEYHPGYQDENICMIRTTVNPGTYQLFLQPDKPNASYGVSAKAGKSYGNDGVPDARLLGFGQSRTDYLESGDLENWYKFVVVGPPEGTKMRVDVTGTSVTPCMILPWSDVDVYGFVVPACNKDAVFTPGTYYVRIGHGAQKGIRQTFTVKVVK